MQLFRLTLGIFVVVCLFGSTTYSENSVSPLDEYRWKNRVLVLLVPAGDSRLVEQQKKINAQAAAIKERDLKVIAESNPSGLLHRYFKPKTQFTAILVGKDGRTKWESSTVFDPQIIFDKIDAMPMRANEMRK